MANKFPVELWLWWLSAAASIELDNRINGIYC